MASSLPNHAPALAPDDFSLRAGRWIIALLPAATSLFFVPALASPFLVAKESLFFAAASVAIACALPSLRYTNLRGQVGAALAAAIFWIVATWAASTLKYLGLSAMLLTLWGILLFFAATVLLRGVEQRFIVALSISAALVSLVAIAQYSLHFDPFMLFGSSSTQEGRMRVFSTLGNPDFTGEFLAACLPAVCSLPGRTRRFGVLALSLIAIACTGSRAAMLAAAIALLVWTWTSTDASTARKALVAIALCVALAAGTLGITRWNGRSVGTALQGRLTIWRVALHNSAWTGYGPGTFSYVYLPRAGDAMRDGVRIDPAFVSAERHAQNDLVEVVVEYGYIGAIVVLVFLGLWLRAVLRRRSEYTALSLATVAALLAESLFDFAMHRGETIALMAIAMALPLAVAPETRESRRAMITARAALAFVLAVGCTVLACFPIYSSRLTRRGLLSESAGDFKGAIGFYGRALKADYENGDAWFGLARAEARDEQYRAALDTSADATRFIAEPELWILRARILESMDANAEAVREMERAATIFPFSSLPKSEIEAIKAREQQ